MQLLFLQKPKYKVHTEALETLKENEVENSE
jgi:hypothetical protein